MSVVITILHLSFYCDYPRSNRSGNSQIFSVIAFQNQFLQELYQRCLRKEIGNEWKFLFPFSVTRISKV
jgi:hypothetical protein